MLVQLENGVVINPETVIFVPMRSDNSLYTVATCSMQKVTEATSREVEVILRLQAFPPENKVLRTTEWGLLAEGINFRYSRKLCNDLCCPDSSEMLSRVKILLEKAVDEESTVQDRVTALDTIYRLRQDQEFYEMTSEGRKIVGDVTLSCNAPKEKALTILDRWDEIFIELPF